MKKRFIHQGHMLDIGMNFFKRRALPEIVQSFWEIIKDKLASQIKVNKYMPHKNIYKAIMEVNENRKVADT